jgi:hypothetical protein
MGLAASQARMLLLTARKSDVEYQGQVINNRRLALTYKLEEVARAYSDGISNRKIEFYSGNTALYHNGWAELGDVLNSGVITDPQSGALYKIINTKTGALVTNNDADYIEAGLRDGVFQLEATKSTTGGGVQTSKVDWRNETLFRDTLDDTDDEVIAAKYEYDSALIQSSDKRLELELKQLDTHHKAIDQEMEAVKKVIEKNIQSSFKTFA